MITNVNKRDATKIVTETGSFFEEFDPRMKLLLVICVSTLTFIAPTSKALLINYSIIILLYLFAGLYRSGVKVIIFVAFFHTISLWEPSGASEEMKFSLTFIGSFAVRVMAYFIMGTWMAGKMRIGDFVSSLEKMHIPKGIIITLAVIFRYLPTARDELYYIISTMKLRGIGISFKNILLHPIRTLEYAIVPLILRYLTIADELSVSAMTRGLDLETKRIPYREVKITIQEVVITGVVLIIVVSSRFIP